MVTAARIITAVVAAGCFAMDKRALLDTGCGLFVGSALLDRIDGELARETGQFSLWGHRLDLVADCSADALTFLGLGFGSRGGALGLWSPLLGVSAAASTIALFWQFNIRQDGTASGSAARAFDPDDAMFLVPVLLFCAGPTLVTLLAGLLTPAVAAYAIWQRIVL